MTRTFDEYSFTTEPEPELRELIEEYNHIINDANPLTDVMDTWTLQKPGGLIEILLPGEKQREAFGIPPKFEEEDYPTAEEIGTFLYRFEQWFYYCFDGYELFFSRFPEIPPILANANVGLRGVLFGYPLADVAEYTIEQGGEFKSERRSDT